jgi:clan AA aspartic protease
MTEGRVNAQRQAMLSVEVSAIQGASETAEMALDTGFTGFLALPSELIARLGLNCLGLKTAILADGREAILNQYEAVVDWHGGARRVPVLEVQGGALLGMALLDGSRVTFDVVENGPLRIEELP